MEQQFDYDVFLSYRHKNLDSIITQKTFHFVESYRLPASVRCKGYKDIHRAFRDTEELPVSRILTDTIDKCPALHPLPAAGLLHRYPQLRMGGSGGFHLHRTGSGRSHLSPADLRQSGGVLSAQPEAGARHHGSGHGHPHPGQPCPKDDRQGGSRASQNHRRRHRLSPPGAAAGARSAQNPALCCPGRSGRRRVPAGGRGLPWA